MPTDQNQEEPGENGSKLSQFLRFWNKQIGRALEILALIIIAAISVIQFIDQKPEFVGAKSWAIIEPLVRVISFKIQMPVFAVILLGAISLAAAAVSIAVVGYSLSRLFDYLLVDE